MYKIVYTNKMKRDARLLARQGKNMQKLVKVLDTLASGKPLPPKCQDHQLSGDKSDFRECHIESDWLLMYQVYEDIHVISAAATGSHSYLFGR